MALLDGGTSSSLVAVGPTPNGRPPRRAIALKLSEETLAQLMALASRGKQPDKGTLQIDLGSNPTFMFNGASYPVTLLEEAPHTELLCYTRAKTGSSATTASDPTTTPRRLERFADVSHKATLKPSTNLDRVSQALREQRSVAEKEKQGKRAVLIESAPTSRSNSKNRHPTSTTSAAPMPLHPIASTSASSSMTTPPAIRQPSRLIAVAQRATPAQVAAAAAKQSPPEQFVPLAAVSPPSTVLTPTTTTHPSPPHAFSPARQHSSASSESSITSSSSLLQHSTASTSTSASTSMSTGTSAQKSRASLSSAESPAAATEPPNASASKPIDAGGGGVVKGKDSLKKEKRQRRKDGVAEAVWIASKSRPDHNEPLPFSPLLMQEEDDNDDNDDNDDEDAEGEVDEEVTAVAQQEPSSLLKKKRRVTIAGGEVGSDASTSKSSRSRVATPTPSSSTPSTTKKRKRALAKSERWYSSSSESEGEASQTPTLASKAAAGTSSDASSRSKGLSVPPPTKNGSLVKRRRTVSGSDLSLPTADSDPERGRQNSDAASLSAPSRASSTSNHKSQPVRSSSLSQVVAASTSITTSTATDPSARSPGLNGTNDASDRYVTITSSASFERHRQLFEEAYPSYRALYDTLMQERQILASKEGARSQGRYTLDEIRKLVKRLETNRDELERIKLGLKKYAMTAGIPLVLNGTTR
ncbi:BQ2448_3083 [Microbotryum intermedium]|uniref:BQ2448_3083 protein n=1 Tax=Microbotryum intermedium TaxID=269621 RepID=A0A238FE92_9BASI|nr:BQ2448_3083 [Microbotryum intermedium]